MTNIKSVKDLTTSLLAEISIDFIVNEMSRQGLQKKYNITPWVCDVIVNRNNLVSRREEYRNKVLDKSIDKCSTYQAKMMFKITRLLAKHIDAIDLINQAGKDHKLTSEEVRDMIAILTTISKEKRLNYNEPTEIRDIKVKVSFPEGYQRITKTVEAAAVEEAEIVKAAQVESLEEEKEEEEIISGPL